MSRPSQQIDQQLIAAGLALLPETGCAGLSVRKLADRAGVNLGMFHYHFKNKDNFIRAVLQHMYEEMFASLQLQADPAHSGIDNLHAALGALTGFTHRHRRLLLMLASEAMRGEALPQEFLRANLPRHLGLLARLMRQGQDEGDIIDLPVAQLLPFVMGAVAGPLLAGAAFERLPAAPPELAKLAEHALLSKAALAQRLLLAMRAFTREASP
ncbi:MAG: TetR/AcrR family transcriptional regulator [Massilia sp.]